MTEMIGERTAAWVADRLGRDEHITEVTTLRGGWTSEMRRLTVTGPDGERTLVLRSFVKPFFVQHAEGLLGREAAILRLLAPGGVPAARLVAVDAAGAHGEHPSLLMTLLPGGVRLEPAGARARADLAARQLLEIHRTGVTDATRPRDYQPWTAPERVAVPPDTTRPALWSRAVALIDRHPPRYRPCFLHRDYHPGNLLYEGAADGTDRADGAGDAGDGGLRISGVVDWVETSWGPADLDVAHCATAHALLYGPEHGLAFADRYTAAGGTLADDPADHLYWRLLDALAFAPDAEKVAVPWRELGRTDLTPQVLGDRLEEYVAGLLDRYGDAGA
ncbi:phosphotransferase family protein [Kitasatospora sp. NPDC088391]|uniref:phosphotransferase family protein n=1 Tax=Kitasatospora sp. NPDC088391 TaxID=3364074 RepID=UPI003818E9CF